ncbi:TonB-dependent siderophore receptor [Halomonas koreensis]|uniref:TonB-dependent siderophore receptor n=1 Tax=Halomonas koreensis TaxID=245385 RepID=A0ABU1G2K3_9GAMM|nr:TonB-dependent siderophore receptor [Halomonas koreensis]MDR5866712.1 TonB-dependent siderophore receptor [Halomonas koreensis]
MVHRRWSPSRPLPFRLTPLSLAVAAALASTPLLAESEGEPGELETMQVWGARVTSSSEYLGGQDIEIKQADHLSDLLRDIPGVDVGGTHSVTQRINIRGLDETDLDIRLDGASQYASMFHHIGNLTLNPDIIQSVDVQVGNNSVTNSGLGGSVHFETKSGRDMLRPGERFGARLYAGYGSNAYRQGSATLYGQLTDSVDGLLYGYQIDRDNFEDGEGNETIGSDGEVGNMLVKLGWEPGDAQRLQLSYDRYQDEGDYSPRPDMGGPANDGLSGDLVLPTEYTRDTLALNYAYDLGPALELEAGLYRNQIELNRDESQIDIRWPANRLSDNTAENINTGANVRAVSRLATGPLDHRFTYGLDLNRQESRSRYGSDPWLEEEGVTTALYLEDRLQLTDAFAVTPGVRYDHFERDAVTGDDSFSEVSWALAADYALTDNLTLFASARELFKAPALFESFIRYQEQAFLADDIEPETGLNSEIGARYRYDHGPHRFASNLTLFQTDIDDSIRAVWNAGQYDIVNDGDVRLKGFEASALYGYEAFSAKLSYSRSDADNRTHDTPAQDANGRSADLGDVITLDLGYALYDLGLEMGWQSRWVLEEDNVLPDAPVKEGYNVHGLYAQWAPVQMDGLVLTLGVDNLFDEQYVSHASRTGTARGFTLDDFEPGRNVKLSAAYRF